MELSSDLISKFVKTTKDTSKTRTEATVYGTVKEYNGGTYVQLDGSDQLTPVVTTTKNRDGDRVTVLVKDHTATITGNVSMPAARTDEVETIGKHVDEFDIIVATKVDVDQLNAESARIDLLISEDVLIRGDLAASSAKISKLEADTATINEQLIVNGDLIATKLDADTASITYATIKNLEATNASINKLSTVYATITQLDAESARINNLETHKLSAEEAELKYANIDFANIGEAAVTKIFSEYGLIKDLTFSSGKITGELDAVEINGDLIKANTLKADRLLIRGEDGIYYRLNINADGTKPEAVSDEELQNGLHGSNIIAKSITATEISVDDLMAFDAKLGGFTIGQNVLYSDVKESVDNTTRGIYMDTDGQISFGDADNYIRYYKNENGEYKLEISAESILFGDSSKSSAADLKSLTEHVKVGTYIDPETGDTKPSISLAEGDSDFKQVITNTETMFMDGTNVNTRINTEGVETDNVTVRNELRQGRWVWSQRQNGNYGLSWKEMNANGVLFN